MSTHLYILQSHIYVEDTDYGGVVYHANYLKFMERARTEWLNSIGYPLQKFAEMDIYFVIASANVRYLKPARLNENISITCDINCIKNASITFTQEVKNSNNSALVYAQGEIVLVCTDKQLKPKRVPIALREKINEC